jgi:hypothetical protein
LWPGSHQQLVNVAAADAKPCRLVRHPAFVIWDSAAAAFSGAAGEMDL